MPFSTHELVQLQRLVRPLRNERVKCLAEKVLCSVARHARAQALVELDCDAETRRRVKEAVHSIERVADALYVFRDVCEGLDEELVTLPLLDAAFALYMYAPQEKVINVVKYRLYNKLSVKDTALLTGASRNHVSNTVTAFKTRLELFHDVRMQFFSKTTATLD